MTAPAHALATVAVVVLNWRRPDVTLRCLGALAASDRPHRTYVVDNGSGDASVQELERGLRAKAPQIRRISYLTADRAFDGDSISPPGADETILVETDRNLGYGGGNNVGIALALAHDADYVWILNNDTIPHTDALSIMLMAAERRGVGLVGSLLVDLSGSVVQSVGGGRYNRWTSRSTLIGKGRDVRDVTAENPAPDFVSGASLLIARDLLVELGGFEEAFHLYCEEIDLADRAAAAGWQIAVAPQAVVGHEYGATIGSSLSRAYQSTDSYFYSTRSAIWLARKEHRVVATCTIVAARVALVLNVLRIRRVDAARAILAGVMAGIRGQPRFRHDVPVVAR